jgi:hypothetical protein
MTVYVHYYSERLQIFCCTSDATMWGIQGVLTGQVWEFLLGQVKHDFSFIIQSGYLQLRHPIRIIPVSWSSNQAYSCRLNDHCCNCFNQPVLFLKSVYSNCKGIIQSRVGNETIQSEYSSLTSPSKSLWLKYPVKIIVYSWVIQWGSPNLGFLVKNTVAGQRMT